MSRTTKQTLYPEEEKMPLAQLYHKYEGMEDLSPLEWQIINNNPISVDDAIKPENFMDLLQPTGYSNAELGWCIFPDGSGYVATYRVIPPHISQEMLSWYSSWMNIHSKSMVLGHGNLRYKIWNPADHFDHHYVNWTDGSDGIYTTESLDLGEGERQYDTIRHTFDLKDYGMTDEWLQELKDAGCIVRSHGSWESFDHPGAHLCLSYTRPCPLGGMEVRSREWIGWRPSNGKLVREERTECNDAYLRKVVIHTLMEWHHLYKIVPEIYEMYKDKPFEED